MGSSRQDSIRSGYMSDHEALSSRSRHGSTSALMGMGSGGAGIGQGVRQQVSIESVPSQDSRMCYLHHSNN